MADQSIRATQVSASKTTAENDLKVALSYIEDAERPFFDKKITLTFEDTTVLFDKLDKAAQYVAAARAKDPEQSLTIHDEKDGGITYTQDAIAGAISYREGQIALLAWRTAFNDQNKVDALRRARGAFTKATHFVPTHAFYHLNLADVCKLQDDKKAAVDHVSTALKLEPESVDAIKLRDAIDALPDEPAAQPKRPKKSHPFLIAFFIGIACWGFGIILASNEPRMTPAGSAPIVLLMLVGLVLTFGSPVAWFLFRTDDDAAYKEYKSARLEQDVVSMIKDSYEQRYQSELERK